MQDADFIDLSNILLSLRSAEEKISNARRKKITAQQLQLPPIILPDENPHTIAMAFANQYRDKTGNVAVRQYAGDFYVWEEGVYGPLAKQELRVLLYQFAARCIVQRIRPDGSVRQIPMGPKMNPKLLACMIDYLPAVQDVFVRDHPPCWLNGAEINSNDIYIAHNGLLYLPTDELIPHTAEYFCLASAAVEYNQLAGPPSQWLKFLNLVFGGDRGAIATLQEWFGYCLTPDTQQQKIMLLLGPPRSGKGTIAGILSALLGLTNVCSPTFDSMSTTFGAQQLLGRSLAIIGDARTSPRSDTRTVVERLLSISGEDALTIDRKHKDPVTVKLPTRFMILSNIVPKLTDQSGALVSRYLVLETKQSHLGKEDLSLNARLHAELPGILNWAIEGWQRISMGGGFTQPKDRTGLVQDLTFLNSTVKHFVNDHVIVEKKANGLCGLFWAAWEIFCEEQGLKPGSLPQFGVDLRSVVPTIVRKRDSKGNRAWRYFGIDLHEPMKTQAMARASERPEFRRLIANLEKEK